MTADVRLREVRLRETALHESAHACALWVFGRRFGNASIVPVPDDNTAGRVHFNVSDWWSEASLLEDAIVLIAGDAYLYIHVDNIAPCAIPPNHLEDDGQRGDAEGLATLAKLAVREPWMRAAWVRYAEVRAAELVARPEMVVLVEALAAELLKHKELTYADVDRILTAARRTLPARWRPRWRKRAWRSLTAAEVWRARRSRGRVRWELRARAWRRKRRQLSRTYRRRPIRPDGDKAAVDIVDVLHFVEVNTEPTMAGLVDVEILGRAEGYFRRERLDGNWEPRVLA